MGRENSALSGPVRRRNDRFFVRVSVVRDSNERINVPVDTACGNLPLSGLIR